MFNQLPVPYDQLDQSTFNGNLPNGNDCVPNINLSQQMMQNQQVALQAIGYFRAIAQSTAQKSPMHVFSYNMLSQNRFQNQVWQTWCQHLTTFVELLIMAKNYNTDDAIKMACTRLYEAFMSGCWKEYRNAGLGNVVPQNYWNGLEAGQALLNQILSDNQKYMQGGVGAFQQQQNNFAANFGNNNNFSNNNNNGGGNLPRINNSAVTNSFNSHQRSTFGTNNTSPNEVAGGLYDEPIVKPLVPVEEISSDVYDQYPTDEYIPMNQNSGTAQQSNSNFSQHNNVLNEETDLKIPLNVEEVVIDPNYFQPVGFQLDVMDPYNLIFNPGGVEIRPAHKTLDLGWVVTQGDDMPYGSLIDPNEWIMFHVRFPDGTVKEKAVEWSSEMNYMRHELDIELRRRAHRAEGSVVAMDVVRSSLGAEAVTSEEIISRQVDGKLKDKLKQPVLLSGLYNGSTDMEVRGIVERDMREITGHDFDDANPMPPVEYVSMNTHFMKMDDSVFTTLKELSECSDIANVALTLQAMGKDELSATQYRFLNARLTKSINSFMENSMSIPTRIDDFIGEAVALLDYIATNKGKRYTDILVRGANEIIRKAITPEIIDDETCITDYFVNYQMDRSLDELVGLNIHDGKPVLVANSTHPIVLEALRNMIRRCGVENIDSRNLRIITSDGTMLELIRGYLIDKAMLLKLVK